MLKKLFSIIFTVILAFSVILTPLTASAYEITGFDITAKAGMLVSMDTGEILYSNNIDQKMYPASLTKIMTVTLMLESEKYDPAGKVAMTKEVQTLILGTGSAVSNFQIGEEITQLDLVYTVLMSSFGDCAYLAAIYYGGSVEGFVAMMNDKAAELGLTGTHYSNPVGLHDEGNYTTVRDVYTLMSYALKNETFKTVCSAPRYTVEATNMSGKRTLSTTNFLIDNTTNYYYQYAKGGKTGYTDEAGRCLVSFASYNGYNYMCVLMNCPPNADRRYEFVESAELYRWAFNDFSFKEVANSTDPVCEMPVELSLDTDFVSLYFEKPFVTVLPNEADDSTIVVKTHLKSESVEAPVKKGEVLGTADVIYAEQVIGTVNLVAGDSVKESKLLIALKYIKSFFGSVYMKVVYVLIALAIAIFIFMTIRLNMARIRKRRVKYIPYGKKKGDRNEH
ncbi:MAG: D-alanyl-D-alanine carboxypeptidase family protein [Acutalibacteraceae bacterium]|nr:D-alanyl-D-alanine carboxypeptidase family protein [Acutalibacteraceae bacterium]